MGGKAHTALDEQKHGEFIRTDAGFRKWIKADGSTPFTPESNRYHLYVSYACPWASRCMAVCALKGLEKHISFSVVHPVWEETRPGDPEDDHRGWMFKLEEEFAGNIPDTLNNAKSIRDLYELANDTLHKYSVPVLWDKKTASIVSNESSEIIRMFNNEFNEICERPEIDLYPEALRKDIDSVNEWVYPMLNNGVYRSGFASKQEPYEAAVTEVFQALDRIEGILSKQRYIAGDQITEADIRLFVTLVRFDEVYVGHFKCNKARLADYPNTENYTRDIYQTQGISGTVNMAHIKHHYHRSHPSINPYGIVPVGPGVDFSQAHDRDREY
eukprot:CFRG5597T1